MEYALVCWVLKNISEYSVDERYRVYLNRAKDKDVYDFNKGYSDNEKLAVSEAIKYFTDLYNNLFKGYPKGHKSISGMKRRVECMERAYEKLVENIDTEWVTV